MRHHKLRIDIPRGTWMVDVIAETNDNGVYDLVYPHKEADVALHEEHLYGFEYNISAPENTPFSLYIDDEVLHEGVVGKSNVARGSGIL